MLSTADVLTLVRLFLSKRTLSAEFEEIVSSLVVIKVQLLLAKHFQINSRKRSLEDYENNIFHITCVSVWISSILNGHELNTDDFM